MSLLQVQPDLRRRPEIARQPDRRVGSHTPLPVQGRRDPIHRCIQRLGQRIGRQSERLEFVTQDLSWMHQPHTVVRGHRFDLLVIVHDLHLAWPVILPPEINPPVRVDPDAVLPGPIADAQRARRDAVRELAASANARPSHQRKR